MSKKSKQETTNTYQYIPTPVTPEITEVKEVSKDLKNTVDPRIRGAYAGMRNDLENSFLNPMGSYTTPAIREATLRAGRQDLAQQEAQALTEADFLSNASEFEREMAIAQLTAPRLVQTGGTSTATQSGGIAQGVIGGGFSALGSYLG